MGNAVVPQRVFRYLLERLAGGQWPVGCLVPSLRDVARELGISHRPVHLAWKQAMHEGLLETRVCAKARVTSRAAARARAMLASLAEEETCRHVAILTAPDCAARDPSAAQLVRATQDAAEEREFICRTMPWPDGDPVAQSADVV
jgi:DNA-binding transcriptional MocR family regulator